MDAGAFPWPISPPKSLQCRLCDDGDTYTSIDDPYDHSVAVHLPKPSPVSLPRATASHHASGARGNASFRRRPRGRRGEETQADSSQVGGWRTWFSAAAQGNRSRSTGDTVDPAGFKKKPAALQEHHAADGDIHQTVPEDRTGHDVVKSMANAATLIRYLKQLDGMRMDTGPRQLLQCRSGAPIRTSSHYSVGRQVRRSRPSRERAAAAGSSTHVRQSTPTQLSRQLHQWPDTLLDKLEVTRPC